MREDRALGNDGNGNAGEVSVESPRVETALELCAPFSGMTLADWAMPRTVGVGGEFPTLAEAVASVDRGVLQVVSSLVEEEDVVVGAGKELAIEGSAGSAAVCFTGGGLVVDGGALVLGDPDDEAESELAILDGRLDSRETGVVEVRAGGALALHRGATIAPLGGAAGGALAIHVAGPSQYLGFGGRVVDGQVVLERGSDGFIRGGLYQTSYGSALTVRGHLSEISYGSFRCLGGSPGQSVDDVPEPGAGAIIDGGSVGRLFGCGMFSDASHGLVIARGGHVGEIAGGKFQSTRLVADGDGRDALTWCGVLVEPSEDGVSGLSGIGTISGGGFVGAPGLGNAGEVGEIRGGAFVGTGLGANACGLLNGMGSDCPGPAASTARIGKISGGKFAGAVAGIANGVSRGADGEARPAVIGSIARVCVTGAGSASSGYGIKNEGGEIGTIGGRAVVRGGRCGLYNSPLLGVGGAIGTIRDSAFSLAPGSESHGPGIYNAMMPGEDGPSFATIESIERVNCDFGVSSWYGMLNAGKVGSIADSLFVGYAAGLVNRPGASIGALSSGTYWGYGMKGNYDEPWEEYNHVYGYLNQSEEPTEVEPGLAGPFGSGRFLGATAPLGGSVCDASDARGADGTPANIVLPVGYRLVTRTCLRLPSRHIGTPDLGFCYLRKLPSDAAGNCE